MEIYSKKFLQEQDNDDEDILIARERESKYIRKLIKQLKVDSHSNKEARAEFAKLMFQICLSSDPFARKFIKKISDFISYFEEDFYISEEDWRKLNNTNY